MFRGGSGLACVMLLAGLSAGVDLPRPTPDFVINMVGGKPIVLGQYRGSVCALAFILTGSRHCQRTMTILSRAQNDYHARGFQAIASAIDDIPTMNVPDFVRHFQPPFPVGYSDRKSVASFIQHEPKLKLWMPQLVFIDRLGTIRAQYSGDGKFFAADEQEKNMRQQIEALLREMAAPPKKPAATATPKKAS